MFTSSLHKDPRLPELYTLYSKKMESQERIRNLKKRIQATHDVLKLEELKCRKRVLRRLGFTSSADIVDVKGRVACEISSGDELLLTELIFNGVFNPLAPEHCAAILSSFVFTEKSEHPTKLKEELAAPLRVMQEIARRIAKVSKECKLSVDEDEYVQSFKVELMDAVVQWSRGASFSEICKVIPNFLLTLPFLTICCSYLANRSVRREPYPGVQAPGRTTQTDGPGCQSDWELGTQGEIRKGF
jgi:ATP-dependent RNA helicase DOB1